MIDKYVHLKRWIQDFKVGYCIKVKVILKSKLELLRPLNHLAKGSTAYYVPSKVSSLMKVLCILHFTHSPVQLWKISWYKKCVTWFSPVAAELASQDSQLFWLFWKPQIPQYVSDPPTALCLPRHWSAQNLKQKKFYNMTLIQTNFNDPNSFYNKRWFSRPKMNYSNTHSLNTGMVREGGGEIIQEFLWNWWISQTGDSQSIFWK